MSHNFSNFLIQTKLYNLWTKVNDSLFFIRNSFCFSDQIVFLVAYMQLRANLCSTDTSDRIRGEFSSGDSFCEWNYYIDQSYSSVFLIGHCGLWQFFFFLNRQKFIKRRISAQDERRPVKYKQKAPYIGGTPEYKNPNKDTLANNIQKDTTPPEIDS